MSSTDVGSEVPSGFRHLTGYRVAAVLTAVLIVVQALLAGRGLFIEPDQIDLHGQVGNVTFLAGIVLVIFAFVGMQKGMLDKIDLVLSVATLLLIVAQIGLGYAGRDGGTPASLHVPNGVLIMGVTGALLSRAFTRRA